MGYCTTTDITNRFKNLTLLVSGDGMTVAKVQALIDDTAAVIDARVGKAYETPVTGTEALKILKQVNIWLVIPDVQHMLGQVATAKDERAGREKTYAEMGESHLRQIESGQLDLSDATRKSTSTFSSGNVNAGTEPAFLKNTRQW